MSSVLILTSGTRGDVEPYVALAQALRSRGLEVSMAAHFRHEELVVPSGIDFRRLERNPSDDLLWLETEIQASSTLGGRLRALRLYFQAARESYRELAGSARVLMRGTDLVVLGYNTFFLYPVARAESVAVVACPLQPVTPSSYYPSPIIPPLGWGGGPSNRLSHAASGSLFWLPWWPTLRRWAARERTRARFTPSGPIHQMLRHRVPFVYGVSPLLFKRPPDWPAEHRLGGLWLAGNDARPSGEEAAPIFRFLDAPEADGPLVYVGFGSRDHLYARVLEVVPRLLLDLGCRVVVHSRAVTGASGQRLLYLRESLAHDWLFPHVNAVVHHGGAGTFGRASRAGVPCLVVVSGADGAFWASRGVSLGISPRPVRLGSTERDLGRALSALVRSPSRRANAAGLGAALRAEDGPARGAELVERILNGRRGGGSRPQAEQPRQGATAI